MPSLLPPVSAWPPAPEKAEAAIEVARCYMDLEELSAAVSVIDAFGRIFEGWPRVLAGECAGDLMCRNGRIDKAIDSYRMALKVLASLKSPGEGHTPEQMAAAARIRANLKEAEDEWKRRKYGPEWVAYFEAQYQRLEKKDLLSALMRCDAIARSYPKTVYAEAAGCYAVKCLLGLSLPEGQHQARVRLGEMAAALEKAREKLDRMRKAKAPEHALKAREAVVQGLDNRLKEARAVTLGPSAASAAFSRAEVFLSSAVGRSTLPSPEPRTLNPSSSLVGHSTSPSPSAPCPAPHAPSFSLYRGETLLDLARHALEYDLDPERAELAYRRAWDWLEKVRADEAALDAYEVPARAEEVSRPPREQARTDRMGNIEDAALTPGMVVNRRTCPWYLDELREQCALSLAFLALAREEPDASRSWIARLSGFDLKTRLLESRGLASNAWRLGWAVEHGQFNALPEELRLYSGRQRFVVLLADFLYCTEQHDRAASLMARLALGEFGALDARQDDYPAYLRAMSFYWRRDRALALEHCVSLIGSGPWTITQDRAAYTAANILWQMGQPGAGASMLEKLANSSRDNVYVQRARLSLGLRLAAAGERARAETVLRKIPPSAGGLHELAGERIEKLLKAKRGKT